MVFLNKLFKNYHNLIGRVFPPGTQTSPTLYREQQGPTPRRRERGRGCRESKEKRGREEGKYGEGRGRKGDKRDRAGLPLLKGHWPSLQRNIDLSTFPVYQKIPMTL